MKFNIKFFIITMVIFLSSPGANQLLASPGQKIIYVNHQAQGNNNGQNWKDAYNNLQSALKTVQSGQQVWVARGSYTPTTGSDRSISFQLVQNTELYGGFSGSETSFTQRNWKTNPTILSGDIGQKSIQTDNTQNVVKGADDAIIDGFIIEHGYSIIKPGNKGKMPGPQSKKIDDNKNHPPQTHTSPQAIVQQNQGVGVGILNFKAAPIVRNCIIRNNFAMKGGGVYNMTNKTGTKSEITKKPVFINVIIENNYALKRGGGMSNDLGANPIIINSIFRANRCDDKGGALYNDFGSSPVIMNTIFEKNLANRAAALGNDGGSNPTLVNVKILDNTAKDIGAGLYQGSYNANISKGQNSLTAINSQIIGNHSQTNGMASISNWGKDWLFSYASQIDNWPYTQSNIPKKYQAITKTADRIKNLDAGEINSTDLDVIANYMVTSNPGKKDKKPIGFGVATEAIKQVKIPDNIFYVSSKAVNKKPDGKSWKTAFHNIQNAIDTASNSGGGQIWVAKGVYYPSDDNNRETSIQMKPYVALYGGFSGNESKLAQRNYSVNQTILSGDIGQKNNIKDNSYHVIKGSVNGILDGFIIRDGNADGPVTNGYGGGMFNWGYGASAIVKNTIFINNCAIDGGGVFNFNNVKAYFSNVQIVDNQATTGGGLTARFGSSLIMENSKIDKNYAKCRGGGAVINYGSNVQFTNVEFNDNKTDGNGGAVWVDDQASQYGGTQPVFQKCKFTDNRAIYYGGAIHNYNTATTIMEFNVFMNNKAQYGPAIANTRDSRVTMKNNQVDDKKIYTQKNSMVN
ncbi:MAG: hypothetical protein GY710_09700 [Desulfobacteraceae bacterium]|nr:hypothetical protein [Desulfobacteraceae bacterium]